MKKTLAIFVMIVISTLFACQKGQKKSATDGKLETERVLVETRTLKPESFAHHITVNGSVEAILEAFVSPETNGQIKKVHVREGQRVAKGELLVSLNSEAIRSGIAEVESGLELAKTVFERRRELWEKKIGSEIQFLEAKTNKESLENRLKTLQAQLDMAEIRSPIPGIVDKIQRKEGELAMPGMELLHVINLSQMRVNAELAESFLNRIKAGDKVEITFSTYPDRKLEQKIRRVSNSINPKNRTVTIQVEFDNPDESIKPNMMAALKLNDFAAENALVVPAIVIKNDMQGPFVYLLEGSGEKTVARKTYVTTGLTEVGQTMIIRGLKAGQKVIVAGYNQINNDMPVREK